jgi:GNAT superfamily N-acetyltransferase
MNITVLKNKTPEIEEFNKKEWKIANKEHYGEDVKWTKEKFRLVAYDSDKNILGDLGLEVEAGVAYVDSLIVGHKYQRKGVAKNLMKKAENIAREESCHKIYLKTGKSWDAKYLYLKLGYKITGELKRHNFKEDFVIFTKNLIKD